jgi:hypothetical protein
MTITTQAKKLQHKPLELVNSRCICSACLQRPRSTARPALHGCRLLGSMGSLQEGPQHLQQAQVLASNTPRHGYAWLHASPLQVPSAPMQQNNNKPCQR